MSELPHKALLPAGFPDVLPPDAGREAQVVESLIGMFASHGYERVKPPLVEFEESLLGGVGATMSQDMFRIMDPISQRMMAVRTDVTVQIARIAGSRLRRAPRPLRLSYAGQVLRVRGSDLRPERQFGQVGVELIGVDRPEAEAEVAILASQALGELGVQALCLDLTVPPLVPALLEALDIGAQARAALRRAIDRKDAAAVAAQGDAGQLLVRLLGAGGLVSDALNTAQSLDLPPPARVHLDRLAAVADLVGSAMPDLTITADFVEHRGFEYHAGVSLTLFARGVRGELGRGGRYLVDDGDAGEPAVGFTLFMDTVLRASPAPPPQRRLYLPHGTPREEGRRLRGQGWATVAGLAPVADPADEARRLACDHVWRDGRAAAVDEENG